MKYEIHPVLALRVFHEHELVITRLTKAERCLCDGMMAGHISFFFSNLTLLTLYLLTWRIW